MFKRKCKVYSGVVQRMNGEQEQLLFITEKANGITFYRPLKEGPELWLSSAIGDLKEIGWVKA